MTLALAMLIALVPGAAIPARAAEEAVTVSIYGIERYDYADQVYKLANEQRGQNGSPALTHSKTLNDLAMQRAAEIALYFSHTRCCGKDADSILQGVYSGWSTFGENIAIGQSSPEQVMAGWMDSQGHRENILYSGYSQIGVGCFTTNGVTCWVQLFSDSSSNTAVTDRTDCEEVWWELAVLPSYLDLHLDGSENLEMDPGEAVNMAIYTVNPKFSYCQPILIPSKTVSSKQDAVSVAIGADGSFTITAERPGTATVELRVFDSQNPAQVIHVTVTGEVENPDPTNPTDPTGPTQETPTSNPFTDVKKTDYFYEPVLWAVDSSITSGMSATQFGPNYPCTRAQVVTFLWHAVGDPAPERESSPFSDVKPGDYFYSPVLWAVGSGITSGISATQFGSSHTCTRGQIVTFLYKSFHE